MLDLKIRIHRKGDDVPIFPEYHPGNFGQKAKIEAVGILEGGMKSGKTSLSFILKGEDGKIIFAELSAALFEMLAGALSGAEQRFRDDPRLLP